MCWAVSERACELVYREAKGGKGQGRPRSAWGVMYGEAVVVVEPQYPICFRREEVEESHTFPGVQPRRVWVCALETWPQQH